MLANLFLLASTGIAWIISLVAYGRAWDVAQAHD